MNGGRWQSKTGLVTRDRHANDNAVADHHVSSSEQMHCCDIRLWPALRRRRRAAHERRRRLATNQRSSARTAPLDHITLLFYILPQTATGCRGQSKAKPTSRNPRERPMEGARAEGELTWRVQ